MKTVLFQYETPVGTFWIHPEPADRVRLRLDGHQLKSYSSVTAAVRAVRDQQTGWEPWDSLAGAPVPAGLHKWKRGTASTRD